MKRIVICCDGTRGKYDAPDKNTNVVRLFERMGPDGPERISYYDPGVGTHSPLRNGAIGLLDEPVASVSSMGITSEGLNGNVREAYRYLMECYDSADQVYLFGYSRGSHTVRVLAGMLHKCGLLTRGSDNPVPYMAAVYRRKEGSLWSPTIRGDPTLGPAYPEAGREGPPHSGRRQDSPERVAAHGRPRQLLPTRQPARVHTWR